LLSVVIVRQGIDRKQTFEEHSPGLGPKNEGKGKRGGVGAGELGKAISNAGRMFVVRGRRFLVVKKRGGDSSVRKKQK